MLFRSRYAPAAAFQGLFVAALKISASAMYISAIRKYPSPIRGRSHELSSLVDVGGAPTAALTNAAAAIESSGCLCTVCVMSTPFFTESVPDYPQPRSRVLETGAGHMYASAFFASQRATCLNPLLTGPVKAFR